MGLLSVLKIIELSLELALAITRTMPPEQAVGFWERHEKRMAFWQGAAERLDAAGQLLTSTISMDAVPPGMLPPELTTPSPTSPTKGGAR